MRRPMMSRCIAVILGVLIVAISLGLEWAVREGGAGTGCAMVENDGPQPMERVVATYAGSKVNVGTIAPGAKAKVWFSGAGRRVLSFEFTQQDNPMKGFQIQDFNPPELRRDGSRLVLVVKNNQVERYVEEDESVKSPPRMLDRLMDWIKDQLR
jgi:hypothetical protein